jgi:hypothetical protein
VRRVLSSGPTPEERIEELLAERRRELDETAARFDESIADLERREELLRDSHASVERMLRLGQTDLEARETELTDFLRDLTERESRLEQAEADVARRRRELGAVELKRASVERRERDLEAREAVLAERELQPDRPAEPETDTVGTPAPASGPSPANAEYEPLDSESVPPESDLGAIAAVPDTPEPEPEINMAPTESTPAPAAPAPPDPRASVDADTSTGTGAGLAFVPGTEYRLVELDLPALERGDVILVEGEEYIVVRVGPSPLPADARRCAYLVRGGPPRTSRGSS